jgi:N-acetyl-alpha-D-muramate 1-phosphate uridylyltransferase
MTAGSMPTKAMVLAAGLGTRMRPLTDTIPKPMVPVAGRTLIDRVLDWMQASAQEVVINTHYMADMLEHHLATRATPRITFSREEPLLETGGGIRKALTFLGEAPFFSANSDTLCIDGAEPALRRLARHWDDQSMDALLLLHKVEKAVGYDGPGDFFAGHDGILRRRLAAPSAPYVFTGVQLIHPRLFRDSPDGPFSLNLLYNRGMRDDGTLQRVRAIMHDGDWLHVGDPAGLKQAEAWLKHKR